LLALLLFSARVEALMGLGNLVTDSGLYQKNRKGQKQNFEYAPYLSFHYRWEFSSRFEFTPELGFAFHKRPSPNHSRMTFMLLYPVSWRMWRRHYLRGGLANLVTRVAGKGGSVFMNNGNGVSLFARPSGATYSPAAAAFLGYEYRFREYLAVRFDTFLVPMLARPMRLAFSLSTNLYYF